LAVLNRTNFAQQKPSTAERSVHAPLI